MSARVYFIKRVKDCKDVSIIDEQWRQTSTTVCGQNINKQSVNIADETLSALSVGITILNQKMI